GGSGRGRRRAGRRPRGGWRTPFFEEPAGGVAQGGVVRDLFQAEVVAQLGEVGEHLRDAAVIGLEEGFERQQGEQLVLGVVLAGVLGRVGGQGLPRQAQGFPRHRPRRFGHPTCSAHTSLVAATPLRDSTKQMSLTRPCWLYYKS